MMNKLSILRTLIFQKNRNFKLHHQQKMPFSTCQIFLQVSQNKKSPNAGVSTANTSTDISTNVRPLGEKIKENTKTFSYTAIILAGVGVTSIMLYAIFRELFSSSSPSNIYSDALERVKKDVRVQDALGSPIKGYGEESRRGRRQHVAHSLYEKNNVPHIRMQFYVQGLRNKATVHLESRETKSGGREFRYLFVQLENYPRTTIILEDNRAFDVIDIDKSGLNMTLVDSK